MICIFISFTVNSLNQEKKAKSQVMSAGFTQPVDYNFRNSLHQARLKKKMTEQENS